MRSNPDGEDGLSLWLFAFFVAVRWVMAHRLDVAVGAFAVRVWRRCRSAVTAVGCGDVERGECRVFCCRGTVELGVSAGFLDFLKIALEYDLIIYDTYVQLMMGASMGSIGSTWM